MKQKVRQLSDEQIHKVEQKPLNYQQWIFLLTFCCADFFLAACVSLQAPFFPKEAERKGASATVYGLVFGVFELVLIFAPPVYAKLVGYATPKFLITSGLFFTGSCSILFGFLDHASYGTQFISLAFAVRIFEGLGCAAGFTVDFILVSSKFPDRVTQVFSALQTSYGMGLIAGPTLGGLLYEAGGYFMPFLAMGILLYIGVILDLIIIPEIDIQEKSRGNICAFLADFGVILDALAVISSVLFVGFTAATLEPYLRKFNLPASIIGLIFIITGILYTITPPLWGWLCDKGVSPSLLCIIGYAFQCLNLTFLGPFPFIPMEPQLWLIITSLAVGGLGMAIKMVCAFINTLKNTARRGFPNSLATHGMVSAMFNSSCAIGEFIGPSVGGFLIDNVGFRNGTAFVLLLELVLMCLTIAYTIFKNKSTNKQEEEIVQISITKYTVNQ